MLLTPFETAVIMSAAENTLVTTRQVYYRLNMYQVLAVKVGTAVRIPDKEIGVYYDDIGKRSIARRAREFSGYFEHKRGSALFKGNADDNLPTDLRRAFNSVKEWRRIRLDNKKRKCNQVRIGSRDNRKLKPVQLEFNFAA